MVLRDATSADANGSLICCVSGTLPFRWLASTEYPSTTNSNFA